MHEKPGVVYLAELQGELSDTGLEVMVGIPRPDRPWSGQIDGKLFLMDVDTKDPEDGRRGSMRVSLFGQDEEPTIAKLSTFMRYKPFARYRWKSSDDLTASFEWSTDPNPRIEKLQNDERIRELQILETGLVIVEEPIEEMFSQATPEVVEKWEKAVKQNPQVEFVRKPIAPFLPFLREVLPRVSKKQSLFGLSLISLDHSPERIEDIVRYATEPLLAAGILTEDDIREIIAWFKLSDTSWEPDSTKRYGFTKGFEIGGIEYTLTTDSYRGYHDLNVVEGPEYLTKEDRLRKMIKGD